MSNKYPGGLVTLNPPVQDPALGAATPGIWTLDQALNAEVTRSWPMYDPYYKNVVLNLHGDAAVGGSFVSDASTNNALITITGNVSPRSSTPFAGNAASGSGYINGANTNYLTTPNSSNFAFGTGDFAIECWVYFSSSTSIYSSILSNALVSVPAGSWLFGFSNTSNQFGFGYDIPGFNFLSANFSGYYDAWTHVAVTRSGTDLRLFFNGSLVNSTTNSTNFSYTSNSVKIGQRWTDQDAYTMTGYISNLRVVKGYPIYTSAFTPSTTPLTAVSGTSLLTLQTPNPANNNGFVDSSSNNFAITRNGNTTQGSFSPYGNGWSNYLSTATSDYLSVASNAAFNFGSGAYTMEAWVFLTSTVSGVNSAANIFQMGQHVGGGRFLELTLIYASSTTTTVTLNLYNASYKYQPSVTLDNSALINKWVHIAGYYDGTNAYVSVNGVPSTGVAYTGSDAPTGQTLYLGINYSTSNQYFPGYISNARIVKGTSVYGSSTFTPSTTPLTAISGTSLLTCQSNRFFDASGNAFAITVNGTPSVQRFSPFLFNTSYTPSTIGGSGYFDGSGDYLSTGSSTNLQPASSDFCVEAWVYPTTVDGTLRWIYQANDVTAGTNLEFRLFFSSSGVFAYYYSTSGYLSQLTTATPLVANQWSHVAWSRSSSTISLFVNGNRVATGSISGGSSASTAYVNVGQNLTSGGGYFVGYMNDVRFVKGSSVYTPSSTTLTVPTAPLTAITNTQLLLGYTNSGIYDNSMMNDLETVGNAQISTSVKKYGTGSMYFDGTGDWLIAPANTLQNLGNGDFTIEGWMYFTTTASNQNIVGTWAVSPNRGWCIYFDTTIKMAFTYSTTGSNATDASFSYTPTTNTWTHVAFVRSGSSLYFFANGVQQGSTYSISTSTIYANNQPLYVGNRGSDTSTAFNGYIDDLRITKGVARYVANFTPPTSQLQDQ